MLWIIQVQFALITIADEIGYLVGIILLEYILELYFIGIIFVLIDNEFTILNQTEVFSRLNYLIAVIFLSVYLNEPE